FQVGPTCYRGLWVVDGSFLLEAISYLGREAEARQGIAYLRSFQRPDGAVEIITGHLKETGIALWAAWRHAQLTGDRDWLRGMWPPYRRAVAHLQDLRRQASQDPNALYAGLIPPGFSDGGIGGTNAEYTNVYWNLAGLRAAVEAATWRGEQDDLTAWSREYDEFRSAFDLAAARDEVPGPGGACLPILMGRHPEMPVQKAQWAFCHAVFPGRVFDRHDPLVAGNLAMLKANECEGLVRDTGWLGDGVWNYFASFYAHAWLWQGDGGKAAETLYAFANHASPLLCWREEQMPVGKGGAMVGDMPHNWASAEFIRLVRHLLVLERGDELHLCEGLPAKWVEPGMTTRLDRVPTSFGRVSAAAAGAAAPGDVDGAAGLRRDGERGDAGAGGRQVMQHITVRGFRLVTRPDGTGSLREPSGPPKDVAVWRHQSGLIGHARRRPSRCGVGARCHPPSEGPTRRQRRGPMPHPPSTAPGVARSARSAGVSPRASPKQLTTSRLFPKASSTSVKGGCPIRSWNRGKSPVALSGGIGVRCRRPWKDKERTTVYEVCHNGTEHAKAVLAELLGTHPEAVEPLLHLVTEARQTVEELVDLIGRVCLESVLHLSAAELAGEPHRGQAGGEVQWHGSQGGVVTLGTQKVRLTKPRLRKRGGGEGAEVPVPAYAAMQQEEGLRVKLAAILLRGVSTRDYAEVVPEMAESCGVSRSAVSRQFIEASEEALRSLCERRFEDREFLILYMDGVHVGGQQAIVVVGVDREGYKHVLGLAAGDTENTVVVQGLLTDLVERGLSAERPYLFVIDGSKALRAAMTAVFGSDCPVQWCRQHKVENVVGYLPKELQGEVKAVMRGAYRLSAADGMARLRKQAEWLERECPSAAASLREGLEETFTINALELPPTLRRCLATTNLVESPHAGMRQRTGRVKRWQDGAMVLRWLAAGYLETEKSFRRIMGYQHLWVLEAKLREVQELREEAAGMVKLPQKSLTPAAA
ncbi:MAG: IS256 family transposase, partial [Armatimonadetes bacterium]|nr:IS256 family transposase [Armatimonadota bacterium]